MGGSMGIRSYRRHIEDLDKRYLWHPFTQMKEWASYTPLIISEGRGCYVRDISGRWYLDGVSSIWVTVHGHRKGEIDRAIREQLESISHSTLLGLTHPPAALLAEKLVKAVHSSLGKKRRSGQKAQPALSRVFYSDNGSTAVEIGLKMAFQYWQRRGRTEKTRFVALRNAYHGDTLGAVSVGGIELFHRIFAPLLFRTYRAPSPYCFRCELDRTFPSCRLACLKEMELLLQRHHESVAAVVIEPIVQGAGGMITAPQGYLAGVRRLCTKYGVLMIADEVATGFGRTGTMFACEHEDVIPDILCLAKGITGGYLPLAATMTREKIYRAFLGRYQDFRTFFHGHTYTGNQLACAAAIANLGVFEKEQTIRKMQRKVRVLQKALDSLMNLPHVGDVRQRGFMTGIELVREKQSRMPYPPEQKIGWKVCERARELGVIIRPLGDVVVLMPMLSITERDIKRLVTIVEESVRDVTE